MTTPYVIDSAYITVGADTITIELPDDIWYNPDRTSAYCILVDLDQICYDPCPMLEVSADANVDVLVDIGWTSAGANECGGIDLTTGPIMVAEVWGCEEPEPEPEDYWLVLYFPFLAPVNNTEVNWWCGVAVSNYANQATNGGWFYMWEEDGDAYAVEVPALGGHEMWLRNLTDMTFERMPGNTDATAADEAMSGILMMQVTTPDYYRNYETSGLFDGAIAGIDAFVLMGDGDQAYGYTARHISAFGEFLFDPFSGRAPIWNKARK